MKMFETGRWWVIKESLLKQLKMGWMDKKAEIVRKGKVS